MKKTLGRIRRGARREDGEIMLESLIVFVIVIFMLFFVLAAFMLLVNRWNMQTAANDAAFRFAQTYKLTKSGDRDKERTGEIRPSESNRKSNALEYKTYRYFFGGHSLEDNAENRVKKYAEGSVERILMLARKSGETKVTTNVVRDALARRHIEVTIEGGYRVLFSETLAWAGIDTTVHYRVTGYAECLDMVDYITTTDYIKSFAGEISGIFSLTDSLIGLINKLMEVFG